MNHIVMKSRRIAAVTLVLCLWAASSVYAKSPEFARTPEEWEHLRDNRLEYAEIEDLIIEYNPTVSSNDYDLRQFKQDYGTSNTEVADTYRQLAEELMNGIDISDSGAANPLYAASAMTAVVNESTAKQLYALADSAVEDYEIKKLGYELARKSITQAAKANMIAYYAGQLSQESAALNAELAQIQFSLKSIQAGLGMATQAEVLSAREGYLNAQKEVTSAQSSTQEVLKKLQVACGWKYESVPELGALPEPDTARIAAIDLASDIQKARDNNYTLKINQRKYDNSTADATRQTLEVTMEGNRQNIGMAVNSAYLGLKAAGDALSSASTAAALASNTLRLSEQGHQRGTVSDMDLRSAQISARIAAIAVEQAKLSLLQSLMNYDFIVDGLASA